MEKEHQLRQIQLLQESLKAAKDSEESKNAFFSNMSHDMRTPLNAIIGLSELAEKRVDEPEELKGYLNKINFDNRHFNMKKCIEDCLDSFMPQAGREQKKLTCQFDIHTAEVYGDSFRLTQILNNLLSNAIKFSSAGDEVKVKIQELEQTEYLRFRITVSDTGTGMSITKNIITQMNGEIDVKSKLGEGSTFTVTLPFKGVAPEENGETVEAQEGGLKPEGDMGGNDGASQSGSLEGRHILLAEDNEINMEIAQELLAMCGAEVSGAWNGKEAVELFEKSSEGYFDVILMDMQMPEMDGCEAARRIRRMKRADAGTIPIIAVTANAFAEDLAATTAAGMNAHISKPMDFELLRKTICSLLEDRRN